jgi:hypothetical protein
VSKWILKLKHTRRSALYRYHSSFTVCWMSGFTGGRSCAIAPAMIRLSLRSRGLSQQCRNVPPTARGRAVRHGDQITKNEYTWPCSSGGSSGQLNCWVAAATFHRHTLADIVPISCTMSTSMVPVERLDNGQCHRCELALNTGRDGLIAGFLAVCQFGPDLTPHGL